MPMTKLSRSKIELLMDCPRCFWLDMVKGIKRPPPAPYTINSAIDLMLKMEFDKHREKGTAHHLISENGVKAIPYKCDKINVWRHNFTGVQFEYKPADFLVFGAVDDVWINPKGELIVVDYKATGAAEHHIYDGYRRQMEIYQWLLRQNGYKVSKRGYFLFARVNKSGGFKNAKLSFDMFLEPLDGDDSWVEGKILEARKIIDGSVPGPSAGCGYCKYRAAAEKESA